MKFSIFSLAPLVFSALLLQATPIVAAEEDHGHDDEHGHAAEKCACMAEELGFAMDCSDTNAMMEALMVLKSSGCNTDCSSPECQKNWYIVQTHHDYCDENAMPNEIEDDFHDYDEVCESCDIKRAFVEGAAMCPTPNCADDSGNEAYVSLVENDCATDCAPDICRDAYFLLVATHDNCDHDALSVAAEEGLHDFEDVCAMHLCNSGDGTDQLVCDEHYDDEDDHGHDSHDDSHDSHDEDDKMSTSSATGMTTFGAGTMLAAAFGIMGA